MFCTSFPVALFILFYVHDGVCFGMKCFGRKRFGHLFFLLFISVCSDLGLFALLAVCYFPKQRYELGLRPECCSVTNIISAMWSLV